MVQKVPTGAYHQAVVAEWLRRWTWNPMGSPRVGSNPAGSALFKFSHMASSDSFGDYVLVSIVDKL